MADTELLPTLDQALDAAQRLINSHFGNDNSARCSIPAQHDDDDLLLMTFLRGLRRSPPIHDPVREEMVARALCRASRKSSHEYDGASDLAEWENEMWSEWLPEARAALSRHKSQT